MKTPQQNPIIGQFLSKAGTNTTEMRRICYEFGLITPARGATAAEIVACRAEKSFENESVAQYAARFFSDTRDKTVKAAIDRAVRFYVLQFRLPIQYDSVENMIDYYQTLFLRRPKTVKIDWARRQITNGGFNVIFK